MISLLTANALATKPSPTKRLTRVHLQHYNTVIKSAFKCSVCDEEDEWQSGSRCGNSNCPYK